jgi:hypothetical protein
MNSGLLILFILWAGPATICTNLNWICFAPTSVYGLLLRCRHRAGCGRDTKDNQDVILLFEPAVLLKLRV